MKKIECKCGVKPKQHWHNPQTEEIEAFFTVGSEDEAMTALKKMLGIKK